MASTGDAELWAAEGPDDERLPTGLQPVVGGAADPSTAGALVGTGAPPVVAVVVTRDPGPWFEAALDGLYAQDYGNLAVLVVDNGSEVDPTGRVAEVLPRAYVKRLGEDVGFSEAVDEAVGAVEGAVFLLVCHDDVRLEPDAVTQLVAEAFRANAGVVGPKVVDWDDPAVLRSVGLAVDAYGATSSLVDPGELDQSQHDIPRDVFAVSDACLLVRADLLADLGGFSEDIPFFGSDVDLCWRAHAAGATVQYCPRAVVAHRGRFEDRRPVDDRGRYELRHQGRMLLANTQARRLPGRLLVGFVAALADVAGSVLSGRFRRVGEIAAAVAWNLVHLPATLRARRSLRRVRRVPDAAFAHLVSRGSYRLRSLVRTEDGDSRLSLATRSGRDYLRGLSSPTSRVAAGLIVAALAVLVVGSRNLFGDPLPVFREMASLGPSATDLLSEWWTAWRGVGLGEPAVPPAVVGGSGALGWVLLGSVGVVRRLLVVLPLFVGALGAWKLFAATGSVRARAAALVVYGCNPVALNALATGRLQALVAFAVAPWLLRRVAAHAGAEPFGPLATPVPLLRHLAGSALLVGVVAAVSPLGAALLVASLVVLGVALALGGTVRRAAGWGMVGRALGAAVLSAPFWAPWAVAAVRTGDLSSLTGVFPTRSALPGVAGIVTGSIGPVRVDPWGWAVVVAGLVPLLTARRWRFGWALAGWVLALASWAGAVALAEAGWVGGAGLALFLVPGAVGAVLAVAMGPLAFEADVIGGDFGAPQLLSGVALAAVVVAVLPVGVAAAQGRWYQPEGDFQRVLALVDRGRDHRTLWLGDPDVLPVAGWEVAGSGGLAAGVSEGLTPTLSDRWRLDGGAGVAALRDDLSAALTGRSTRLGAALAPMGIRYVVVVDRPAPQPFAAVEVPPPAGTVAALEEQLDLESVPLAPGASLFRTTAPWPLRADVAAGAPPGGPPPPAVLGTGPGTSFSGELADGAVVAQAVTADPGWTLTTPGGEAERSVGTGWANRFAVADGGPSTLAWATPVSARALQAAQVLGLVVLLVLVSRRRGLGGATRRRHRRVEVPLVVMDADAEPGHDPGHDAGRHDATAGAARADAGGDAGPSDEERGP